MADHSDREKLDQFFDAVFDSVRAETSRPDLELKCGIRRRLDYHYRVLLKRGESWLRVVEVFDRRFRDWLAADLRLDKAEKRSIETSTARRIVAALEQHELLD
jgi:hypothetical protein